MSIPFACSMTGWFAILHRSWMISRRMSCSEFDAYVEDPRRIEMLLNSPPHSYRIGQDGNGVAGGVPGEVADLCAAAEAVREDHGVVVQIT
jgi:hypothetical protein